MIVHVWRSHVFAFHMQRINTSQILLLALGDITQLEERKDVDKKNAGSIPLYATIFLQAMFACWHTS